jgi:hypothetical protein
LKIDGSRRLLLIEPIIPEDAGEIDRMRERLLQDLRTEAQEALANPRARYPVSEIANLKSIGVEALAVYRLLANSEAYRRRLISLRGMLEPLSTFGEEHGNGVSIPLVSANRTLIRHKADDGTVDVIPALPQ